MKATPLPRRPPLWWLWVVTVVALLLLGGLPRATAAAATTTASHSVNSVTIVATLDGVVHALDPETGEELWQVDAGGPLVSAKTSVYNHVKLIPGLDGSMYVAVDGERLQVRPPHRARGLIRLDESLRRGVVGERKLVLLVAVCAAVVHGCYCCCCWQAGGADPRMN